MFAPEYSSKFAMSPIRPREVVDNVLHLSEIILAYYQNSERSPLGAAGACYPQFIIETLA
jgi:hypothetical protein